MGGRIIASYSRSNASRSDERRTNLTKRGVGDFASVGAGSLRIIQTNTIIDIEIHPALISRRSGLDDGLIIHGRDGRPLGTSIRSRGGIHTRRTTVKTSVNYAGGVARYSEAPSIGG